MGLISEFIIHYTSKLSENCSVLEQQLKYVDCSFKKKIENLKTNWNKKKIKVL